MVGWHHQLNGHESIEQALGHAEGHRGLAFCSSWGRKESDMTQQLNTNTTSHCHLAQMEGLPISHWLKFLHPRQPIPLSTSSQHCEMSRTFFIGFGNSLKQRQWQGFPGGSVVKNSPANAGDAGSVPGLGRSPGEGNDNPLQCSCLGNPMDRGAWRASVYEVVKSQTQLSP